ncbi:hypothetical protein SAMN04488543_3762 [Friedmanniella luteola]|uniref:HD domain-containing protein n=1 Tax=Friedmanniella luteola TaxID=546871 RepID=A0A1H1ZGX5_9ACTN|nr:hypothetical protein [Friedmanniella luteola]SDT32817.1 hypothetical protein SAMN04488543_3762 [Friedmanniella luteola]
MEWIAGVRLPDAPVAAAADALVRGTGDAALFHHGRRVFVLGTLRGRRHGQVADPELLYVAALVHALGLVPAHRTPGRRFELDGADLAARLLLDAGRGHADVRTGWLAVALHTTPEVPAGLEPEVALVAAGVDADLWGDGLADVEPELLRALLTAHPRRDFGERYAALLVAGVRDRPPTRTSTLADDVLTDPSRPRPDPLAALTRPAWPA